MLCWSRAALLGKAADRGGVGAGTSLRSAEARSRGGLLGGSDCLKRKPRRPLGGAFAVVDARWRAGSSRASNWPNRGRFTGSVRAASALPARCDRRCRRASRSPEPRRVLPPVLLVERPDLGQLERFAVLLAFAPPPDSNEADGRRMILELLGVGPSSVLPSAMTRTSL